MRITSGTYRGRTINSPKTIGTRPMTDKVRAALFDILGEVDRSHVLDAYAGSGALGFEALSRGAAAVTAIEAGREATQAIRRTVKELDVGFSYSLIETKVETWLARQPNQRFDLIFAMPPYALLDKELLSRLSRFLNPDAIMAVEYPRTIGNYDIDGLQTVKTRSYGDPFLAFYKLA